MDFASFGIASVACITVICYLAATAVKQTPLANKWLPSICGALGGLLGREEDLVIPWQEIGIIGEDAVLVHTALPEPPPAQKPDFWQKLRAKLHL